MQDINFYIVLYYYASYVIYIYIHSTDSVYNFFEVKLSKGIQDLANPYLCEGRAFLLPGLFDFTGFEVLWIGIVYSNINGTTEYVGLSTGKKAKYQNWDGEQKQNGSPAMCPALTNRITWMNYSCMHKKHYVCEKPA